MPKRAVKAIGDTFRGLSQVGRLKAEIELLTRCSGDTVYRLRYDTMQYDYISPAVEHLLGYSPQELTSINLRSLILETRIVSDGMRAVESYGGLEENRKRGDVHKWQADYLMRTRDGRQIWVADISYPWFDARGGIVGSIGSLRDITERIRAEEKIREELIHAGERDALTGLANRQMFWSNLEGEMRRHQRTHGDFSLLLMEVDQFHKVAEAYGAQMADEALAAIAGLLRTCLRGIDVPARLNTEEFGIILPETNSEGAALVATRIRDTVARHTFFVAGEQTRPVGCTVSIGIATTRLGQNMDAMSLYKLADTRLYIARHTGESQISSEEMAGNFH